ncbi:class I SAM-dependent methyltransferase [Shouchella hunanensis]|uniref:Class I SAM-dependent methyltransferase n=1 Tax=Shouchella hunanensis TaxID=766894 RepID=A0ABY7W9M5_9BACI|nr:class I SAM-dependent methyltransferase [Shouchella hunanensis]WDF04786.1 class I SAM-dependent methyltransferase [Shouchella hunanensis]
MDNQDLSFLYNRVGKEMGWNFTRINAVSSGVKWDFYKLVRDFCSPQDMLLDLGTGGAEQVLTLADAVVRIDAVDNAPEMVKTAERNVQQSKKGNVFLHCLDNKNIGELNRQYDLVTCCHAPFHVQQLKTVMKDGAVFMTQQVSEGDKQNIKEWFNRGQAFNIKDGSLKDRYVKELQTAGYKHVQAYDYDAIEYYQTENDLAFLLEHTPIVGEFGKDKSDYAHLHAFCEHNQTDQGIKTNSKRFMIVAIR